MDIVITNEVRDEYEASASPTQMQLYASTEAGRKLRAIANQFNITNQTAYGIYAVTAGDVVLGLVKPVELEEILEGRLPGLPKETAAGLAAAVIDFAAPALAENGIVVQQTQPLQEEIEALESTVSHLEPIRTMASDMDAHVPEEAVYTSSQDVLLGEQEADPGPRWESESSQ